MQHTKEVLIMVGITVAIATIAGAILGGSSISQAQVESLVIESIDLKKGSGGDALLSIKVKNAGNSPISDIRGMLFFDDGLNANGTTPTAGTVPDDADVTTLDIAPTDLGPGETTVYVETVGGSAAGMEIGESYTLSVSGTTQQDTTVQDIGVATVSRF